MWKTLENGPAFNCPQCGDLLEKGDDVFEGSVTVPLGSVWVDDALYCSEGCCQEYESHNDGLGGCV
jgi:hypothetical protein